MGHLVTMRIWLATLGVLILAAALLWPFGARSRAVYTGYPQILVNATDRIDRRLPVAVGIGCLVAAVFLPN